MGTVVTALDTIKSVLTTGTIQRKATFTTGTYRGGVDLGILGPGGQRLADWSAIADNPKLERSYRLCATAYACATFLADAVAESPLRVYRTVDGELEEMPDHRARYLIANPNPYMSEAEFTSLTVMVMALYGYAAIEKVRSGSGLPVQLWPLRPDWLQRERVSETTTRWVLRRPHSDPRVIADEDLILIPYRHDEKMERVGISPLQIVAREIGIDVALTDLLKVFLDAGGIPPWAVELPDANPDQADIDVFREKWRQMYGGWGAYANIGILYGGMKLHKLGDSIGDMAWPDLRGLTELKIAQAFRVPAELIQARDSFSSGSLTTTEVDGAMAALQKHGATPLRQRIDGAFSRGLLPDFTGGDSSISFEFDISAILALQEDRDQLHARVRADFDSGAITLNQFLQETGRPDLGTNGDVYKVPFNIVYLPASALADEPTTIQPTPQTALPATTSGDDKPKRDRTYRNRKAMTPFEIEVRSRTTALIARDRQKLTQILDRKMRQFFKAQGERMVDALLERSNVSGETKARMVDWDGELTELIKVLNTFYAEAGDKAFSSVAATTGVAVSFDLANPNIRQMMDVLGTRIVGINETTRLDVSRLITTSLQEGLSPASIADKLTGMFEDTYKGRAMAIARTETQVAYNSASQIGYQESGVVDQVEMVDGTDHTEDYGASDGLTCATRDGMIVPVANMHIHIAGEHPNGSLAFIPLLTGPALGEV